jgi:pimeloyl-ACP methyl ester carboxylesterase
MRAELGSEATRYDLLVVDQRGTGRSGRLSCPSLAPALVETAARIRACAAHLGPAAARYTTRDSVADLEAVRAALGIRRLVLFGVSYGTKVAEAYASAYPARGGRVDPRLGRAARRPGPVGAPRARPRRPPRRRHVAMPHRSCGSSPSRPRTTSIRPAETPTRCSWPPPAPSCRGRGRPPTGSPVASRRRDAGRSPCRAPPSPRSTSRRVTASRGSTSAARGRARRRPRPRPCPTCLRSWWAAGSTRAPRSPTRGRWRAGCRVRTSSCSARPATTRSPTATAVGTAP